MSPEIERYLQKLTDLQSDISENGHVGKLFHPALKALAVVFRMLENCECHLLDHMLSEEKPDVRNPPLNGGVEKHGQNGLNPELSSRPAGSGHSSLNNAPVSFLEAPRGLLKWVEDRLHDRKT